MNKILGVVASLLLIGALGCSKKAEEPQKPVPEKLNGVLTQAQKDALEKAKQVEDKLKEGQEKLQEQLDNAQ